MSQLETQTTPGLASLVSSYDALLKARPGILATELGGELSWLRKARERDAMRWQQHGFPTKASERWRYTSLAFVNDAKIITPPAIESTVRFKPFDAFPNAAVELVFFNGHFIAESSRLDPLPDGVSVIVLSKLVADCIANGWSSERLEKLKHFRRHLEMSDADLETIFASINTSFMQDAVLIELAPGAILERPIAILNHSAALGAQAGNLAMSCPRLFAHMGRGASGVILEAFSGASGEKYFSNAVTDLRLEERARLSHCRVQHESHESAHIATTRIHQQRDSFCETFQFSFGGRLARQDLHISLEAVGAEAVLDGLYIVDDRRHTDHYTKVDHLAPHTVSDQVYKGILDGESRAVFNGHVHIFRDAQKANAGQVNNNLVLDPKSEVDTRPELNIDADDVKATHGATIGRIDPEHVFYLQTRAISKEEAQRVLARGFAKDIAFRIRNEALRETLIGIVDRKFEELKLRGANG